MHMDETKIMMTGDGGKYLKHLPPGSIRPQ